MFLLLNFYFFFSSRRRHTIWNCDWSSDVCSSDLDGFHVSIVWPRVAQIPHESPSRKCSTVTVTVPAIGRHFFLEQDRKSTRLNSSHSSISYAVFCLKKKNKN